MSRLRTRLLHPDTNTTVQKEKMVTASTAIPTISCRVYQSIRFAGLLWLKVLFVGLL
jgi:hypothetical protein